MKKSSGFTFVELLVVITIIGIIFASGIVTYTSVTSRSRDSRRKSDLESIRQALEICRSLTGEYPSDISSNVTCINGNIIMPASPQDPKPCPSDAPVADYTYLRTSKSSYTLTAPCMEEGGSYQVTNP